MHLVPAGVYLVLGMYLVPGVCLIPGCLLGGVCSQGVSVPRGRGVSDPGEGVSAPGGACSGGVCSGGCMCVVSQHALRQTPPCEQNDRQV